MSYAVRRLLNHLPIQLGVRSDRSLRTAHLKHVQIASFLEAAGFWVNHADQYSRSLRWKRKAKGLLMWASALFVAWVILESTRAIFFL